MGADMLAFARQCLDGDERVALAATPGPWEAENEYHLERGCRCGSCYEDAPYAMAIHDLDGQAEGHSPFLKPGDAEHIARWNPASVLANVKAKRRILDICEDSLRLRGDGALEGRVDTPCWDVVEAMVQPYAGQPGWREEWRA